MIMSKRASLNSQIGSNNESVPSPSTTPRKPAKSPRNTQFNDAWIEKFDFLIKKSEIPGSFHCIPCCLDFKFSSQGVTAITDHFKTQGHTDKQKVYKNTPLEKLVDENRASNSKPIDIKELEGLSNP